MNWIQCLTLTFIIQATLACFITDCPHGLGKRSDISLTKKPKWKFPQVSCLVVYCLSSISSSIYVNSNFPQFQRQKTG